jgi:H+-transporting ATPase
VALNVMVLPIAEIQTLMFAYLMYSAQATIYITRVRGRLWSFAPSRYVAAATIGNVIAASALAIWGILMAAVPAIVLAGTLGAVVAAAPLLDEIKSWIFQKTRVPGRLNETAPQRGA